MSLTKSTQGISSAATEHRDTVIDLLRILGIAMVMLAHCYMPEHISEIREFDVITLVFVSGWSFGLSRFVLSKETYPAYVRKRIRRLVLPVWGFLAVFYAVFMLFFGMRFTPVQILLSALFLSGGIGFVWVYRIFFINALITPFFKKAMQEHGKLITAVVLFAALCLNEVFYVFVLKGRASIIARGLVYLVTYTVSYGVTALYGMLETRFEKKEILLTGVLFLLVYLIMRFMLGYGLLQDAKYPPQLYYVSYGLACTNLLYVLFSYIPLQGKVREAVIWLSTHAMDLYLWHIVIYYLIERNIVFGSAQHWSKWVILMAGSVLMEVLYTYLRKYIRKLRRV